MTRLTRQRLPALRIAVAVMLAIATLLPGVPGFSSRIARAEEGVDDHFAALVGQSISIPEPGFLANDQSDGVVSDCRVSRFGGNSFPPGTLADTPDGGFSFTPTDPSFQGSGSAPYRCSVGVNGEFDHTYSANITIYFVNSLAVTAEDDEFYLAAGQTLEVSAPGVLDNDLSELPSSLATGPDAFQGSATLNRDGSFVYEPPPTSGDFGFPYTLTNVVGTSDTAFATVHVLGPLTLANDAYATALDTPLVVSAPGVLANDPSKDSIFGVVISSPPGNGTAAVFGGLGGIKYTPDPGFEGTDSFTYAVTDALGRIKTATVTVKVGTPDAVATLSRSRTTVNTLVRYTLTGFVPSNAVQIFWVRANGSTIALPNGSTDAAGSGSGSFKVPATVGGAGQKIRFKQGSLVTEVPFEVIPRIKILTDPAQRGQTVNVSLRGYAKGETVRIRWKRGSSFVQLATVKTSSTGSANVNIVVPAFAADGEHTVRGDGTVFRSETKVVTVLGGPTAADVIEPSATTTPSPSPTATATEPATSTPAEIPTIEPTAEATAAPTVEPTVEVSPEPTQAVTVEPSPEVTQPPPEVTPPADGTPVSR